jgi:hypothetical protein
VCAPDGTPRVAARTLTGAILNEHRISIGQAATIGCKPEFFAADRGAAVAPFRKVPAAAVLPQERVANKDSQDTAAGFAQRDARPSEGYEIECSRRDEATPLPGQNA